MSLDKVCRLCLYQAPVSLSLLNNNADVMLESLTSIKITPSDEFLMICTKCNLNLKLAYNIQQKIIKANEKLQNGYLNTLTIKQEYNPIQTEQIPLVCSNKSKCIICNITRNENSMKIHLQQHFEDPQFCDLCNQNFANIQTYREHLPQHPKQETYKCKKCKTTFYYKSFYNSHLEKAHPSRPKKSQKIINELQNKGIRTKRAQTPTKVKKTARKRTRIELAVPQTCNICSKTFTDKEQFRHHSHKRKLCPICKKNITEYNFSRHVNNHSSGPQICEQCGKTYKDRESLRGHMIYMHGTKSYECKECKITFKNRHRFGVHQKKKHSEPTHVCETCGHRFAFSYNLKKHIKTTHLKERPYICNFCKKGFSGLHALKTHRRQHTNETPYKCEVCGEGFRQNVSLKSHKKTKHNIVEELTCRCEVCGKGFASLHALNTHMRCH